MSATEYRRAIAEILRDAAALHLVEEAFICDPRKGRRPLSDLGNCLYLVDRLAASDFDHRRWMCAEFLQPELGVVIAHLRRQERMEQEIALGTEKLAALGARVGRELGLVQCGASGVVTPAWN